MIYLSGCSNTHLRICAYTYGIGLMLNPDSRAEKQLQYFPQFAVDNGCFSEASGKPFVLDRYLAWLEKLRIYQSKCLFVVAPDRFHPSGWHDGQTIAAATLERSIPVMPLIRKMGYKVALVAQNGLEKLIVPWDAFDTLFIGGDTTWKLGWEAMTLMRDAVAHGKGVHVGRVNTIKRLALVRAMGADSCDGTTIKYGHTVNFPRVLKGLGIKTLLASGDV